MASKIGFCIRHCRANIAGKVRSDEWTEFVRPKAEALTESASELSK